MNVEMDSVSGIPALSNYFNNNGCREIFSTTTNLNKVKSNQDYIKFKELNCDNIENLDLEEIFDFDVDFLVLNAGLNRDNIFFVDNFMNIDFVCMLFKV